MNIAKSNTYFPYLSALNLMKVSMNEGEGEVMCDGEI